MAKPDSGKTSKPKTATAPVRKSPTPRTKSGVPGSSISKKSKTVDAPVSEPSKKPYASVAHAAEKPKPAKRTVKTERKKIEKEQKAKESNRKAHQKEIAKKKAKAQREPDHERIVIRNFFLASVLVVLAGAMLYPVAKEYYQTARARDQLEAEYAALASRNDAISEQIANLQTDEGVEDQARSELGWVKKGENAVTVTGIGETTSTTTLPEQVTAGSVEVEDTWVTKVLDFIFRVE